MSDDVDTAQALMDAHIASGLGRVDAAIPAGVAGECDDCGEHMPRLVGGRCGFCRDGRRPPLSRFDDLPAVSLAPAEEKTMPLQSDVRNITIQARGELREEIERRAEAEGLALGQVAKALVEQALAADRAVGDPSPATQSDQPAAPTLDQIHLDALLAEIGRRVSASVPQQLLDAAIARAESVEGQLEVIRGVLSQVRPQD